MELENIVLIIIFSILLLAVICMVGSHLCNETTNIQVHIVSPNEANNKKVWGAKRSFTEGKAVAIVVVNAYLYFNALSSCAFQLTMTLNADGVWA